MVQAQQVEYLGLEVVLCHAQRFLRRCHTGSCRVDQALILMPCWDAEGEVEPELVVPRQRWIGAPLVGGTERWIGYPRYLRAFQLNLGLGDDRFSNAHLAIAACNVLQDSCFIE